MSSEFFAGYIGGIAGVLVGHPFDTIKVYIQTRKGTNGAIGTFKQILDEEGVRGLFKGISSPLFGTAFLCSVLFGVNGICTKTLPEDISNTARGQFVAGSIAGFSQCLITTPMELVKIRMQLTDTMDNINQSKQTLRHQTMCVVRENKSFGILFKGFNVTLMRDIPGFGVYFGVNQWLINMYKNSHIERNLQNDILCVFIAGGLAGVASWIPSYPFDVIKTRIQGDKNLLISSKFIPYTKHTINKEGLSVLTRGMSTQLVRAFPVNAFTFCAAAIVNYILGNPSTFKL